MSTLIREHFTLDETIVTIITTESRFVAVAKDAIADARSAVEAAIAADAFFKTALEPHTPVTTAKIIQSMAAAGASVGVGPMAAVAGAIAWHAVKAMQRAGASYALVDNGGDIALLADRPVTVGLYAGTDSPVRNLALSIEPRDGIIGICTSSGTIGPSISFGKADCATVISPDVARADAAATALGNAVTGRSADDVERAFSVLESCADIEGALIIAGEHIGMWGAVPPLVRMPVDEARITKG